jgi:hypothetical protein
MHLARIFTLFILFTAICGAWFPWFWVSFHWTQFIFFFFYFNFVVGQELDAELELSDDGSLLPVHSLGIKAVDICSGGYHTAVLTGAQFSVFFFFFFFLSFCFQIRERFSNGV